MMGWYDNKKDEKPTEQQSADDVPQILKDFRHVGNHAGDQDWTEGQRDARKFKESNYAKFVAQLVALENEYRDGGDDAPDQEKPVEMDIGTAKCVELCEKLLRDTAEKVK